MTAKMNSTLNYKKLFNMFKSTMIAGAGGFLGTCLRFLSDKLGSYLSSVFSFGNFHGQHGRVYYNRYAIWLSQQNRQAQQDS